jgi:hypothetical protein
MSDEEEEGESVTLESVIDKFFELFSKTKDDTSWTADECEKIMDFVFSKIPAVRISFRFFSFAFHTLPSHF